MVLANRATYRRDDVEAYLAWANASIARLEEVLVEATAGRIPEIAQAHLHAARMVEGARRQSAQVVAEAIAQLRRQSGDPALGLVNAVAYDASEFDAYVAWARATIGGLQEQLAAVRSGHPAASADGRAAAELILQAGRAEAAQLVAYSRRQLRDTVAAQQLAAGPAPAPAPPPVIPLDRPPEVYLTREYPIVETRPDAGYRPPLAAAPPPVDLAPGPAPAPSPPAELSVATGGGTDLPEPKWARRGRLIRNTGVLLVLFVMYQLFGTNIEADRSQKHLMSAFSRQLGPSPAAAADGDDPSTTTTTAPSGPPPQGDAVAIIQIPKIGVEQAVVEGTAVSDLRKGPGHYTGTPLPGELGNSGIAGHRTTYGAPFSRLDELVEGDPIIVRTRAGTFRYEVKGHGVVKPSEVDVLNNKGDNRITLTTCHPKFSARQRYVVWAVLSAGTPPVIPAGLAPAIPNPTATELGAGDEAGTTPTIVSNGAESFHLSALPATLLWGLVLFAANRLARRWGQRWNQWAAMAVASPALGFALLHMFRSLSHFLPSNY